MTLLFCNKLEWKSSYFQTSAADWAVEQKWKKFLIHPELSVKSADHFGVFARLPSVCVFERERPHAPSAWEMFFFLFSKISFHSQKVSASSSIVCPGMILTFKTPGPFPLRREQRWQWRIRSTTRPLLTNTKVLPPRPHPLLPLC